jgi:deazaflavin-dependent oxidoreductase (nitroreductase family)
VTVELTLRGTRGGGMPRFLRRLLARMAGLQVRRYRRSGGQLRMYGQPLILVATTGAKSGVRREAILARFADGDSTTSWLIAGTAAGSAAHPAWFLNMAQRPDQVWVEVDGREQHVRPQTLSGAERDAAWQQIVSLIPSFANYPRKTDRQIPVIRLSAIE